ncbi:MAG: M43 family zinc metalloprotease [Bacteroidota bacterium]
MSLMMSLGSWAQGDPHQRPHLERYANDSVYRQKTDQIEDFIYRSTNLANTSGRSVLTIPVVVHVMHLPSETTPAVNTSNPTDDQIQQAIDWLNDAFRNRSPYGGDPLFSNAGIPASDTEIEFCLAKEDPQGNVTTGINRVSTSLSNLFRDDQCPGSNATQDQCLKGLSFWNSNHYMNIWIVNDICTSASTGYCGVEGYSYLAAAHGETYDGCVIDAQHFGTNPEANVALIHEAGHYLNLFDTYFDPTGVATPCDNANCLLDGDRVCDTPPDADRAVVSCQLGQFANTCSTDADDTSPNNPFTTDVQDLYENYMDGGDHDCHHMYTPGQKARMRITLLGVRSSLLSSNGCNFALTNAAISRVMNPKVVNCESPVAPIVEVKNLGNTVIGAMKIRYELDNGVALTHSWSGDLQPEQIISVSLPGIQVAQGRRVLTARIIDVNAQGPDADPTDDVIKTTFLQTNPSARIDQFPYMQDFEGMSMPNDWSVGDYDQVVGFDLMGYTDCNRVTRNQVLRYNTNGIWNNGAGPTASNNGTMEALVSPVIDLRNRSTAFVSFNYAFKRMWDDKPLRFKVKVMEKCGLVSDITTLFNKGPLELETSTTAFDPYVQAWSPPDCQDWGFDSLTLDNWVGQEIRLIFEVTLGSAYSQNFYLDNIYIQAEEVCEIPQHIPTEKGVYIADEVCRDGEGWSHFWKKAATAPATQQDLLLLSIKDLGASEAEITPDQVKVIVTGKRGDGGHEMSQIAPYVKNVFGWQVMGRYFHVTASAQPASPLMARFYFDEIDIQDMSQAVDPTLSAGKEEVSLFLLAPGVNPDPASGHEGVTEAQYSEFAYGQSPGFETWAFDAEAGFFSATFLTDSLGAGSLGIGKEGHGMGAMYPTPIEELRAKQSFGRLKLEWKTTQEKETDQFILYRSRNGNQFEEVGTLLASGNAQGEQVYELIDGVPEDGNNYYKVHLKHANGVEVVSDTLKFFFDPSKAVRVFPNPVKNQLNLELEVDPDVVIRFGVYNASWQRLAEQIWISGQQTPELDLSALPAGIYFYVVFYQGKTYRGKLIKQPD